MHMDVNKYEHLYVGPIYYSTNVTRIYFNIHGE